MFTDKKIWGGDFSHTDIRGIHYFGGMGAYVGYVTFNRKSSDGGVKNTEIKSEGYVGISPCAETLVDKENKVGWACQKAGGELTTI